VSVERKISQDVLLISTLLQHLTNFKSTALYSDMEHFAHCKNLFNITKEN